MIEALMPATVATAVAGDEPVRVELFPEEERALGDAIPARRLEFGAGRTCARTALGRLGFPGAPVGSGPRGEPLWPEPVVGSITHCRGYRACAVALRSDLRAIGIDAEPHAPLPDGVLATVAGAGERAAIARLGPAVHWDRVLFSAKEAAFKAWFPMKGRMLGFEDAVAEIDPAGAFTVSAPGVEFHGRWRVAAGLLATAVLVAR